MNNFFSFEHFEKEIMEKKIRFTEWIFATFSFYVINIFFFLNWIIISFFFMLFIFISMIYYVLYTSNNRWIDMIKNCQQIEIPIVFLLSTTQFY